MKTDMKTLRAEAEALLAEKIDSKAKLCAAIPTLVRLQEALVIANRIRTASKRVADLLAEACTKYAEGHETIFEKGRLIPDQNGVRSGDIDIGETTFHLACGYDGYMRTNGEKITQEFLATLPEGWVKTKNELDTTGVNAANPSDETLEAYGLAEKPNNVWSKKDC